MQEFQRVCIAPAVSPRLAVALAMTHCAPLASLLLAHVPVWAAVLFMLVVVASFVVNVRTPQLPDGGAVKLKDREKTMEWWAWDEKLTLEFNGARPAICAVEIAPANVPTVFLLGDSTICDQPRAATWPRWA